MVRWLDGPFRKQINFSYVSNIVIENILQKIKKGLFIIGAEDIRFL